MSIKPELVTSASMFNALMTSFILNGKNLFIGLDM
jgi:hypothetical protein